MNRAASVGLGSLLIVLVTALTACAPSRSVRVEPVDTPARTSTQRPAPQPIPQAGDYRVTRGDTLYGIAFRHGLDYRELARRNGIAPPYTIYPGQTLRLGDPSAAIARPTQTKPPASSSGGVIASTAQPPATSASSASRPTPTPGATTPATTPTPTLTQPTTAPAATQPVTVASPSAPVPTGPVQWRWPANGQIVTRFTTGDPTRQGVGIAGNNGQAVLAAGDGVVVYSGSGLIGYGELVIIKHSDEWLSAYGHNRKRLVNEGQAIKAGQQVAEMGRSGASRDMLHFEIRRNGKPVDPLLYLPKR